VATVDLSSEILRKKVRKWPGENCVIKEERRPDSRGSRRKRSYREPIPSFLNRGKSAFTHNKKIAPKRNKKRNWHRKN